MRLPTFVSRNGALVLPAQANISVFNPALYSAYGVYESLQVVAGAPFARDAHLERLFRSAAILELPMPADKATFAAWIAEALAVNAAYDCTLRLFVVGAENGGASTAFIWPQPAPAYPPELYTQGAPAITFEGCRALPQAKSLNTLVSFIGQRRARAAGVHEALLHHDGLLTEGTNSNLFAVTDGIVMTPPAAEVLAGVTRDILLGLAAQNGIPVSEQPLRLADLPGWREAFITSSSRHLMPVTRVDGRPVGAGQVGETTHRLMALFEAYFARATGS